MLEEKVTPIINMLPSREQLKERIVSLEQENERLQGVITKMKVENNLLSRDHRGTGVRCDWVVLDGSQIEKG